MINENIESVYTLTIKLNKTVTLFKLKKDSSSQVQENTVWHQLFSSIVLFFHPLSPSSNPNSIQRHSKIGPPLVTIDLLFFFIYSSTFVTTKIILSNYIIIITIIIIIKLSHHPFIQLANSLPCTWQELGFHDRNDQLCYLQLSSDN